jgi:hypothetical protein
MKPSIFQKCFSRLNQFVTHLQATIIKYQGRLITSCMFFCSFKDLSGTVPGKVARSDRAVRGAPGQATPNKPDENTDYDRAQNPEYAQGPPLGSSTEEKFHGSAVQTKIVRVTWVRGTLPRALSHPSHQSPGVFINQTRCDWCFFFSFSPISYVQAMAI